jgi:hypothetical protein
MHRWRPSAIPGTEIGPCNEIDEEPILLQRDSVFSDYGGMTLRGDKHAFIPIPAAVEHPTLESVNRLTHEHELKSYLDSAWALRPLELVRERGQTMLVVNHTGGEPLDRLVR